MVLAVLLVLVAAACAIVLLVRAVIGRNVDLGVMAAGLLALAWAVLAIQGVRLT